MKAYCRLVSTDCSKKERDNMWEKLEEIKNILIEDDNGYYGQPHGARSVMMDTGFMSCGFFEYNDSFGWIRSSGTYICFERGYCKLYVSGRRHSIDEFLGDFFTKEEMGNFEIIKIDSWEPERPLGDTL